MNTFLPSSSVYKINARVNGVSLDECSFITASDKIQPYFEESVTRDPDITGLLVSFRNDKGEISGWRTLYSLNGEAVADEILISVNSLDDNLPYIPMPADFSAGRYSMISQVMSGNEVLQRTEKPFYFIGNTNFSYDGINVHFPGIAENSHIIPREMTILLEAKMEFNIQLDPYIIWYNGRRKISEGRFSEGAGFLLWKAPDQSGFYSVTAEVFPSDIYNGLTGYQKEVSLLVSAITTEVNLVSHEIPQLVHWYTFEGNLYDSNLTASLPANGMTSTIAAINAERSLKALPNMKHDWIPVNGTYGLAAGYDKAYAIPVIVNDLSGYESWQTLFRFMPVGNGEIFSVQFSPDVFLYLDIDDQNFVLTLSSPLRTDSQSLKIYTQDSFITAGVSFYFYSGFIYARINISGNEQNELNTDFIRIDADIDENFQITLGQRQEGNMPVRDRPVFTAIWDEFAVYRTPPMDIILSDVTRAAEITILQQNYISSN